MEAGKVIQGRCVTWADVGLIRELLVEHTGWNRSRLSRELCERWDWRNEKGRPKDMACRTLLLKLERMGQIRLPPRHRPGRDNARGFGSLREIAHDSPPIMEDLKGLRPLRIEALGAGDERLSLFNLSRNDVHATMSVPVKDVFLYPLTSDFRGRLLAPACSRTEGRAGR